MSGTKRQIPASRAVDRRGGSVSDAVPRLDGLRRVSTVASNLADEMRALQDAEARLKRAWEQRHGMCRRAVAEMEADRQTVSHQLHEELGPMLAALKFAVEEKRREIGAEESEWLQEIVDALASAVGEVRKLSAQLRPVILDDLGLIPTLTWFLRHFESTHGNVRISTEFSLEEHEVSESLKIFFYRLVAAAVRAAACEAKVTRIAVRLSSPGAGKTALRVSGDGCGEEAETKPPGIEAAFSELREVAERAALFGGECTIRPGVRGGSMVQAVFHEPERFPDRRE